jgi:hypothetical protein
VSSEPKQNEAKQQAHVWKFITAMWSDWVGRVSGSLSFIFTILASYYQFIVERPKLAFWLLAGAFWICAYLIASFSVWDKTRPDQLDNEWIKARTDEAGLQKLKLEISYLRWQNSLLGRLNHLAIAATIVATIFGLYHQYQNYKSDRQKEYQLNVKELTTQLDNQYNSDLQRLLQYPIVEKESLPEAVFLFQDLKKVIEEGYAGLGLEGEARRNEVGFLLDQVVRSPQFDLNKARNVEFDRRAIVYCDYYKTFLRKHPSNNMEIISNYKDALLSQHYDESSNYRNMKYKEQQNRFDAQEHEKDKAKHDLFLSLFLGYKEHVGILVSSSDEKDLPPQEIQDIPNKLKTALCWYYGSTKSRPLTQNIFQNIFPIDEQSFEAKIMDLCQ